MANLNENNEAPCAYCGNLFSKVWTDKDGYRHALKTTYCSKACAAKAVKGVDKDSLEKEILDYIDSRGSYCTGAEICNGIGRSSKTLTQNGLKISELNESLGFTKSKSRFQEKVGEILKEEFPHIETEKQFVGLVGNTGHPLRVDFFIPEKNLVIEADGSQHSDPKHPWREWNNGTVTEYDSIKDRFFSEQGIRLRRIPYKRNLKKEDVLSRLD